MSQEPFSVDEIQFIASERVRALGQLRNNPEDRRRMAEAIADGFRVARASGYMMPLIIAVRTWGSNAEVWSGPAEDPGRPDWTRMESRSVTIVEA